MPSGWSPSIQLCVNWVLNLVCVRMKATAKSVEGLRVSSPFLASPNRYADAAVRGNGGSSSVLGVPMFQGLPDISRPWMHAKQF